MAQFATMMQAYLEPVQREAVSMSAKARKMERELTRS